MKLFYAVVIDLLHFAIAAIPFSSKNTKFSTGPILALPATTDFVEQRPASTTSFEKVVPSGVLEGADTAYVAVETANVMKQPLWAFDGVIDECEYGQLVKVIGYEGRFVRVLVSQTYGWVLKDEITRDRDEVFPVLKPGVPYLAADTETKKLRQLIRDAYFCADLYLPLQSVEYVTYVLGQQGLRINWPTVRPRIAGSWQSILKGVSGVFISISPKTGSVMEYFKQNGEGQVLYVQSVLPDETILVRGVGLEVEGVYSEITWEKAFWQSLGGVFIQCT